MALQHTTLGFKMLSSTFMAAILSYICMQRDWALLFIPILLAVAILFPAQHYLKRKWLPSIIFHLALSYSAFGTGAALLWFDLGFIMSLTGFSIMSVFTGMLIFLGNSRIITYQKVNLKKILLATVCFAIIPFVANEIASISKQFNVFWIFLLMWQVLLGWLIGSSVAISTQKIDQDENRI